MAIVVADAKSCSKCKQLQPISSYGINSYRKDGHNNECKSCYNLRYLQKTPTSKRHIKFGKTKQEYNKMYYTKHYLNNKGYYANKCAVRERNLKQATPKWACIFFIEEAYELAQLRSKMFNFQWEVDHMVPIKNELVCGLHVEHNLQVVPAVWNKRKSNKWDCEKGVGTWLS